MKTLPTTGPSWPFLSTGRWTLVKVVAGEQTILESYGPASTSPGTTVMLRFDGDRIEVDVDGVGIGGLSDPDLQDRNRAGFSLCRRARGPHSTRSSAADIVQDHHRAHSGKKASRRS